MPPPETAGNEYSFDLAIDDLFLLDDLSSPFVSDEFIIADCLTDLFTDQATSPRHAITASPRNPKTAPTAMNTAPSGVLDVCI